MDVRGKVSPPSDLFSLDTETGAVKVHSTLKGSATEKSGIKAGDILISMDGERLTDLKSTTARLADVPIGKDVHFVVKRPGQDKTIVVRGE